MACVDSTPPERPSTKSDIYTTLCRVYTSNVTKRLIDIDDELLEMARELADAETIRGTVEEALRRLVRIESTKRHLHELEFDLEPRRLLEETRGVDTPPGGFPS